PAPISPPYLPSGGSKPSMSGIPGIPSLDKKTMKPHFTATLRIHVTIAAITFLSACAEAPSEEPSKVISSDELPLYIKSTKLWTTDTVPVCWEGLDPEDRVEERAWVRSA